MSVPDIEIRQLVRDKYGSLDAARAGELDEDLARLAAGEPLAYVIGWMPFLGLRIDLSSRPLIPRPETEWWTKELIEHIRGTIIYDSARRTQVLDLCAGSGAIGLAVLAELPHAQVSFGELGDEHVALIKKNLALNCLDEARAQVRRGDLYTPFMGERFDIIATNPPYVPSERLLDDSVTAYEPKEALYAGADGLDVIRRIIKEAPAHMNPRGELWIECDTSNIEEARGLMETDTRSTELRTDQYGRPRLVVGYYP